MKNLAAKTLMWALFFTLVLGGMVMAKETEKIGVNVVDIQADFTTLKNGSLAVDGTDEAYVKTVEKTVERLKEAGFPIYARQDWHPASHISFFTRHPGKKAFDVIKLRGGTRSSGRPIVFKILPEQRSCSIRSCLKPS